MQSMLLSSSNVAPLNKQSYVMPILKQEIFPSPGVFFSELYGTISDWCSMWGMLLNPNKSHSLIVSRARNLLLPHPPLILNGSVIQESKNVKLLGILTPNSLLNVIYAICRTIYRKRLVLCISVFLF